MVLYALSFCLFSGLSRYRESWWHLGRPLFQQPDSANARNIPLRHSTYLQLLPRFRLSKSSSLFSKVAVFRDNGGGSRHALLGFALCDKFCLSGLIFFGGIPMIG